MTPALVHVPGMGLDGRSSEPLRRRVPMRVVLLPGMGLRGPVPPLDGLADRLLGTLGQGPVVLIGHSQSCQVVVAAAQRDPRITGLVLLGPTTDPRLRSVRGLTGRWLRTFAHERWRSVPRMAAQWLTTGPRAMRGLWVASAPDRIELRLPSLAVPVIVVRGTDDRLCPHDWAAGLATVAPEGRLVEIPGAGHMTPQTHPDEVAAVLSSLVEDRSPSPG